MHENASDHLGTGLKQRHISMIAIGGIIGAGLFVGSSSVLKLVGPGAFLTYAVTGLMVIMVMRMLGEMAASNPGTGSFTNYARLALGNWAGFATAWLYWYFWVILIGFEAVAGAGLLQMWLPNVPLWVMSLGLMIIMTISNLLSVRSFGEFEYWFAGIKVGAILLFLLLGGLYVLGFWPGRSLDFSNLYAHGGFFPHGVGAIFSGIVIVIFSMVGAEVATIAAAETENPTQAIVKATRSVVARILIFYIGSVFLLAVIVPWDTVADKGSPFVLAFETMGISWAGNLLNAVILTAVLSCLNAGIYTASRMLFVLAGNGDAPKALVKVNRKGVPANAILASTLIGYFAVVTAYVSPDRAFLFLLNSSGAVILFVYLIVAVSQFVLRRRTPEHQLPIKMWCFPAFTILTIAGMIAILAMMGIEADTRSQLLLSLGSVIVIIAAYFLREALAKAKRSPVLS